MAQKLRFGLVLGRLAIMKKKFWVDYEKLLIAVFSWAKKIEKYCSVGTKKLHIMKVKKKFKKNNYEF